MERLYTCCAGLDVHKQTRGEIEHHLPAGATELMPWAVRMCLDTPLKVAIDCCRLAIRQSGEA